MPSYHIDLAQYAGDTALVATSKQPQLLLKYLETYLTELETWLRDWRIAINVDTMSTRVQPYSLRLDALLHLGHSGFLATRYIFIPQ